MHWSMGFVFEGPGKENEYHNTLTDGSCNKAALFSPKNIFNQQ